MFDRMLSNPEVYEKDCINPSQIQPHHFKSNSFSSKSSTKDDEESNLSEKCTQIPQEYLDNIMKSINGNKSPSTANNDTIDQKSDESMSSEDIDDNSIQYDDQDDKDYTAEDEEYETEEENKKPKRTLRSTTAKVSANSRVPREKRERERNTCSDKKSKILKLLLYNLH